jgi:octaprenyl-diphosphate synthase
MTALLTAPPLPAGPTLRPNPSPLSAVAADLQAADDILAAALAEYGPPLKSVVDLLSAYRGKRLRPAVLLLAAKACGGVKPAHRTLAAAVEMIHTATLVHDDVLDGADRRRHARTVNALRGNTTAILLGDMLFSHAFHLTASLRDHRRCDESRLCR